MPDYQKPKPDYTPPEVIRERARRHAEAYERLNFGVKRKPLNNERIGGRRRMDGDPPLEDIV